VEVRLTFTRAKTHVEHKHAAVE